MSGKAGSKNLVLVAMIFAVAMTFIDQTIVSIAVPQIQKELHLSSTGVQWVVNAYLLSLAALFAFGGRLADMVGHRRMVVIGVLIFVLASVMCGLTPANSAAEGWIVTFRVDPGSGRRPHVPGRAGARGQRLPPAGARSGHGGLLRRGRRAHGDRAHPRGLPERMDVAGHLLGERPRGAGGAGPHRRVAAPSPRRGRAGWTTAGWC